MQVISLIQGSPEWAAYRATAKNASDAPAMLGISPYKTRAALMQERASGISPEVMPEQQRIFDRGHHFEALARPLAEKLIFDDLSPCVGTDGTYSASFDGITFGGDIAFEHKTLNDTLRAVMQNGCKGADLPEHYRAQMEQQAMVSGCERILFMASRFDANDLPVEVLHCWYTPDPVMRARLIAGWAQFDKDVAAWQPTETAAPAVATPQESLPAVVVQVQGALTIAGNLPAFGQALRAFIERIPTRPETDQQFADADAACKALRKAEDALTQAEEGALAQISDVELMRRTVADLKELARTTRLATEKLVKAEKDARRTEKVMAARAEFDKHVARLQTDIKGVRLIVPMPDFGGAIKGLSSLASIDDKLTAALLAGQAEANTLAGRIANNLRTLDSVPQHAHLFADRQELAYKDAETLELLMQKRVDAEAAHLEAESQRIRQEEERKAQVAAEAKAEAERARIREEEQEKARREAEALAELRERERQAEPAQAVLSHRQEAQRVVEENRPALEAAAEKFRADPRFAAVIAGAPSDAPGVCFRDPPENIIEATSGDGYDNEPTLKLGDINARLAPLSINAAGLAHFGIAALARDKNAHLFSEAQFCALLGHLARHIHNINQTEAA